MPARIKISIYSTLREKLGWKEKEIIINSDHATLLDVLRNIPELYKLVIDEKGGIREGYMVLVNGIHVQFKAGTKTSVSDGDEIAIFPPGGGG